MSSNRTGFTLIELLVVLAILSILATLAMSAYARATHRILIGTATSALQESVTRAQREALVRNARIVLCSSPEGRRCSGDTIWESGWIGFVDTNRDRNRQPEERLVLDQRALEPGLRVRSTRARTRLGFQPHGGVSAGSNVTFTLCAAGETDRARALTLGSTGRLRQSKATSTRAATDCL